MVENQWSRVASVLDVADRPVLVAGAGVTGRSVAALFANYCDIPVVVADDHPAAADTLAETTTAPVIKVAEAQQRIEEFSLVVVSPGWRPDAPLLTAAQGAGVPVIGDVELAWRLDQAGIFGGGAHRWVGITGTNGKTTTTAMTAHMVTAAGIPAIAVGNIGTPVLQALAASTPETVLVCELSSFQLHWTAEFTPDVGVLLNLAEDHLDWHGGFAEYALAKLQLLRAPTVVVGDDPVLQDAIDTHRETISQLRDRSGGQGSWIQFSANDVPAGGVGVAGDRLLLSASAPIDHQGCVAGEDCDLAPAVGISPPGPAGIYDAAAAATAALIVGADSTAITAALASFTVADHRGQCVHTSSDGVQFIDNSKATNPHAALSAMQLGAPFVWIAGGQLKGADIRPLLQATSHNISAAIVLGVDRQQFADALAALAPSIPVVVIDSTDPVAAMNEAVSQAVAAVSRPGVVLLAPAAASLDMYSGMAERGNLFAAAARAYTQ
ncbi:UDP-N-acetylmuramoyl-L-alanine--D-glutamate ligase [Corynebacterium choanae]|uniref:UDP-N-acetylmuramoylalanine--D-glutamate ligase n=1 Tax=Corynebacterium choanae TaxID=1862358 RepID=A0A3G6JBC6_9CORY|nr:UDP-N-acetylmuramoyl-L-alanine--D-glutamate ligase [Corynebacterium choanae]AZA13950.1 UDP-N-acetylmuramoylalanine--D-glutamate ligase [Corynebacterium choanae]